MLKRLQTILIKFCGTDKLKYNIEINPLISQNNITACMFLWNIGARQYPTSPSFSQQIPFYCFNWFHYKIWFYYVFFIIEFDCCLPLIEYKEQLGNHLSNLSNIYISSNHVQSFFRLRKASRSPKRFLFDLINTQN